MIVPSPLLPIISRKREGGSRTWGFYVPRDVGRGSVSRLFGGIFSDGIGGGGGGESRDNRARTDNSRACFPVTPVKANTALKYRGLMGWSNNIFSGFFPRFFCVERISWRRDLTLRGTLERSLFRILSDKRRCSDTRVVKIVSFFS